jgi:hypothetical protein
MFIETMLVGGGVGVRPLVEQLLGEDGDGFRQRHPGFAAEGDVLNAEQTLTFRSSKPERTMRTSRALPGGGGRAIAAGEHRHTEEDLRYIRRRYLSAEVGRLMSINQLDATHTAGNTTATPPRMVWMSRRWPDGASPLRSAHGSPPGARPACSWRSVRFRIFPLGFFGRPSAITTYFGVL